MVLDTPLEDGTKSMKRLPYHGVFKSMPAALSVPKQFDEHFLSLCVQPSVESSIKLMMRTFVININMSSMCQNVAHLPC